MSATSLIALGAADLRQVGIFVISLVLAITVHEFAHALVAHRLGDPTPEREGRLTLNPVAHADPIGTLLLPILLSLSTTGLMFGWGRPVNTQPRFYRRTITMRAGMALVSFAGPFALNSAPYFTTPMSLTWSSTPNCWKMGKLSGSNDSPI